MQLLLSAGPPAAPPPAPPAGVLHQLLALPILLYRARLGWILGHRFLLLTHRGRRTGRVRRVVLEAMHHDPVTLESIVMAGWGERTQWLKNIEAGGAIEVATGRRRYRPLVRRVESAEAECILAGYEHDNRLIRPVLRYVLSRLLGWRYDGSDASRWRAVEQLVLVGLRPSDGRSR